MKPHRPSCHPYAFTLMELLVVITIITVLISILIPTIGRVMQASKRTTCTNNLRQIYTGALSYAVKNNGYYPLPCPSTADGAYCFNTAEGGNDVRLSTALTYPDWQGGFGWMLARLGSAKRNATTGTTSDLYISNWRVFYCPTADRDAFGAKNDGWWTLPDNVDPTTKGHTPTGSLQAASNYAQWNPFPGSPYHGYAAMRMTDSPRTVLTGDKLGWIRSSQRFGLDYRPTNNLIQNHLSGGNFVFNDGHVEFRVIANAQDKTGFRVTGSTNSSTAYWYALPDVKNGY